MDTVECPYCGEDAEICHDDGRHYYEDKRQSTECEHCEKSFMVSVSISYYFEGEKADCLNGAEHDWRKKWSQRNIEQYPELGLEEECHYCDESRKLQA